MTEFDVSADQIETRYRTVDGGVQDRFQVIEDGQGRPRQVDLYQPS